MASQRWIDEQVNALVSIGIDAQDAQRSVHWVTDNVPAGEDEAEWIPDAQSIYQDPTSAESIQDARTEWYASDAVPVRFKRLLDARVVENE